MEDKIVKVRFNKGETTTYSKDLVQWSHGHILQVEGLSLPDGNIEVHFSLTKNRGNATVHIGSVTNNVITVDIPDYILTKEETCNSSYDAWAWIYLTDENSGRTIRKIPFTIETRAKPTAGVPEPKQDEFLDEVRKIMSDTKEIAQSVRDDADSGKFDGEKGERGEAGGFQCIPCKELPTTDIIPNVYYLLENGKEEIEVKGETVVKNKYVEYMYINGEWEIVGSISIGMDLTEYVKKTDYATTSVAGLVKPNARYGTYVDANGLLSISGATADDVDTKASSTKPITPYRIDYAVMKALTDSKNHEWTDDEKALARTQIGAIGSEDYATKDNGGVVKVNNDLHYGIRIIDNGTIILVPASVTQINNRSANTTARTPITPSNVDYAVKEVLINTIIEWTDEEKASARELLGALGGITPQANKILVFDASGKLALLNYSTYPTQFTIPYYTTGGALAVGTPTGDSHATTKKYVDGLVGSVESILTELHTYTQTKIGGDT